MQSKYTVGLDIGGTYTRIGMKTEGGELCNFQKHSTKYVFSRGDTADSLAAFIENYIRVSGISGRVNAVAIGFPSPVDKNCTTVLKAPNISGFDGGDIKNRLTEKLGIKVFIDKDTNFLLLTDIAYYGVQIEQKTILGVYVGTGIGGAVMIDGKIHRGRSGAAGEIGHIAFANATDICGCGNRGCAEIYASGSALKAIAGNAENAFAAPDNTDKINRYIESLALPVAAAANILDPDVIFIGGGVVASEGFPYEYLTAEIKKRCFHPYPADNLNLIFSSASPENVVSHICDFAAENMREENGK